ncbi:hypothetical protein K9N68_17705 [Kovacikia minuta CCNUW1]|uniref:hypothetical protein n=1 Tax=Kovacikia minuta TaxID=2931930 RepID=UPI001CCDCB69|nr:hypothetical protein [Kovacikia minuta]UBF23614.1 hypothetical protein K9N68_17705 [Kovacikia minuta CCNUW1]
MQDQEGQDQAEKEAEKLNSSSEIISEREFAASALLFFVPLGIFILCIASYLYPGASTSNLAKRYLNAVIANDAEQAASLASSYCKPLIRDKAREDIPKFGGATVRDISIKIKSGNGSDEEVEFAYISFQYRKGNQTSWQLGKISILTNFRPGLRHLECGG